MEVVGLYHLLDDAKNVIHAYSYMREMYQGKLSMSWPQIAILIYPSFGELCMEREREVHPSKWIFLLLGKQLDVCCLFTY